MSGQSEETNREDTEESMNLCPFTTLSTIAVQAGQSQIVISVLKSGSRVHLQLVQVQPGLCDVGSNPEENEMLIQEQQQLLEKLKKHENEVLAVVEKKADESKRRSRGVTEQRMSRKWEEKERLKFAMKMSITEGWSLLLHLLEKRLEVLNLASDFYRQATEFAASIDRSEGLQVKPGEGGPTATQLSYNTMRKDLLKKSLYLLTSCSILMQELRVLQRIEALQRKGRVLQDTTLNDKEEEEGSPHSRQVLQRLEELVEELQDRRRRADQAIRLQLRQPADGMEVQKIESDQQLFAQWDCSPTVLKMQDQNLQFESISPVLLSTFNLEETRDSNPGSGPDLSKSVEPRSRCEDFRKFQSGSTSDRKLEIEADQKPNINSELVGSLNLQAGFSSTFKSHKTADLHSGLGPNVEQGFGSDLIPESRQLQAADQMSDWGSSETEKHQAGSRSLSPNIHMLLTEFRKDNFSSGSESSLKLCSTSQNKTKKALQTRTEETKDLQTGSRMDPEVKSKSEGAEDSEADVRKNLKNRFRTEGNPASGFDPKPKPRSEASQRAGSGSEETRRQELILKLKETKNLESGFKSQVQSESGSKEDPRSRSEDRSNLQPGDVREPEVTLKEDRHAPAATNRPLADLLIIMEDDAPEGEGHAHCTLLNNQRQQRSSLLEWLEEKVCRWTQLLSDSWKSEWWLSEAEHTLETHLQLQKHILSADQDLESWEQILGPNKESSKTGPHPPGEVGRQMTSLKALTKRLKGGCVGTPTGTNSVQRTLPVSQSLGDADRVGRVLKELQVLRKKTDCSVQLLQSYVGLLRTAQQVDVEMKELREHFQRRKEEDEEEAGSGQILIETLYLEMKKKMHAAEELGDSCIHAATMGSELNSQTLLLMVQQTMKQIGKSKLEMEQLRDQEEDARLCREYQERLSKTLQDLKCVSELLDSCTFVDLGLDLDTSKLLEHFRRARPHFSQLDAEVEVMLKSWQKVKQILARLKKLQGDMVEEEDVAKMVKLQETVKSKIQQSESILELTSRFHMAAKQLEELLHAEFRRTSTGSSDVEFSWHGERRQQVLNLFKTSTALGGDICAAVKSTDWARFRVEQLEARLLSLDSLCGSWLNEAAQREEELHRDQLTQMLQDSINQLWDSFRELKKCFSNTRFNYLKRNNRTRNLKVVRNQLQQVEVYGEKLQAFGKRVHGVEAHMSLQAKDGGKAQQLEDTINELRKQMGELERSLCEHQKTLDMTSRLHQAMQEYQFWCEEANSTITRVVKFSTECRSPKAISTLHCQLEKFVWPTVPEQEERISQITELAEKLYGVEEGQRYVEKTIKKHCEIVASIRELSRQLVELEAKLKMDKEETQEGENEEQMTEKSKQRDNRSTEEDDGMSELKETGHTPEVPAEDAGKEALSGKQTSAKREASFQKTFHEDENGSSSLSCSPVKTNRRANTVHSQPQAVATQPQLTTSASQKTHDMGKAATSCGLNITPAQDSSAEVELQKEAITEDCLSNDEYDCASPDDISLPPLAETPESAMFQSDVEEALCISSHSLHVSRVSCQGQSEQSTARADTGSVPQQRHSNPTEGCSSPSVSLYSSTSRFKSESSSFVQSPLTLPAPRLFTSTLCTTLTTSEISSDIFSMSGEKSIGSPKPSLDLVKPGSSPVCRLNSVDCSSDSNVPERRSAPPPPRETKNTPTSEALNLNLACLQPLNDPDSDLHKCRIHPEDAGLNNSNCTCPQSKTVTCKNTNFTQTFNEREIIPHQDRKYTQNSREATVEEDTDPTRTSSAVQQRVLDCHSNVQLSRNNLTLESPRPTETKKNQNSTSSVHEKLTSCPQDRNPSTAVPQSSKAALQIHLPQSYTGSRSRLVQKVLPLQNEVSTDCTPRTKSCTTATTVIKHSVKGQPSIEDIFKLNKSLNNSIRETQMGYVHSSPEAECVSSTSVCSSKTLSMEQSLQTVCPPNESKSTSHTQPCVHGPSMNHSGSVKPTAPPQPEAQTQALSQQVNPHVSRPAPPHPLTPHQDTDICLPIAVREEIRVTPQIKGPPHPPGSPCFTRPLSQTAMIEGSPVMLEVEVMGHQDPMLTWFKEQEAPPSGDRGKPLLLLFEATEGAGGLLDVQQDQKQPHGVGKRLLDPFDVTLDWHTGFGIICVLLWLFYLILL